MNVSGNVFRLAQASAHTPEPVDLGNIREGQSFGTQNLSLSNTAANDGFSESLNASIGGNTGDASSAGSISLLGAGQTDSSSLSVGLGNADTSIAGAKSGTANISLESDGTGTSGIVSNVDLGTQTVNVSGNVFRLAQAGAHTPEPVVFADSHVGDTAQQALSLSNTAANDGFSESLNATIGGATGNATASGSFSLLGAGATDNASLVVGIDTGTAGARSGTTTISLESDGTGTSGIVPNVDLGTQTVNVSGNVYRLAGPVINNPTINIGNVHVGDTASQTVSISNGAAADGFSENLNASANGTTGGVTASGGFTGLAAGASNNAGITVGFNTGTAGAVNGTASIALVSDGAGINSLGQTALASQQVQVTGGVYNLAAAMIGVNPINFGNVHVGDTVSQGVAITNSAPAGAFSEGLDASFGTATDARITNNGGSIGLLAAGSTDNTSMSVGLDTTSAGVVNGTIGIDFASNGAGTSGLGITTLASQDLGVQGAIQANVIRFANPVINNTQPIAFGNFREGDAVTAQAVSISNDVPNDGS